MVIRRTRPVAKGIVTVAQVAKLVPDVANGFVDVTGERFGLLTVVGRAASRGKKAYWRCVCDCGATVEKESYPLRNDSSPHCGCQTSRRKADAATTHGLRHHAIYYAWKNMMNRCYVPSTRGYRYYGRAGIKVCAKWHLFDGFLEDMWSSWGDGLTLERDSVSLGYGPSNCRWATRKEQARNKSNTRWVRTVDGRTISLAQLAEERGVPYKRLHERITDGMSLRKALTRGVFK